MSNIYPSADTAETVNRAVKNIQGTTTTTDGAAADGMIISENLKPIIQNVTTYTNPTVTKTDTGVPPLSFHAINAPLIWSISGNVDTGTYVGELSDNLFDKNNTNLQLANCGFVNGVYTPTTDRYVIFIPVVGGNTYSFNSAITESIELQSVFSIDKPEFDVSYKINDVSTFINHGNVTSFTRNAPQSANWMAIQIYSLSNLNTNIMITNSNTPSPYEPYGVNIPIKFNGNTYNTYISDYLRKSTGDTPVYDIMNSDGTIIRNVNSDGTPAETPTTETYTAPELYTIWGWNVFDVDTTVSPSNVSVTYNDV